MSFYCECNEKLSQSLWCISCQSELFKQDFDNWTTGDDCIDNFIKETQLNAINCNEYLKFIPSKELCNLRKANYYEVGDSLFTGNWSIGPFDCYDFDEKKFISKHNLTKVALISFKSSTENFLRELKLQYYLRKGNRLITRLFGVTKINLEKTFTMVFEHFEWDIRRFISHRYNCLTWSFKLNIFESIINALCYETQQINNEFIPYVEFFLNQLGLDDNNEKVPVIGNHLLDALTFAAPELFCEDVYSSAQIEVYMIGMLFWEFTENKPPFYNMPRNSNFFANVIDGERPHISNKMPECLARLTQKCWCTFKQDRPKIDELMKALMEISNDNKDEFVNAENLRIEKLESKGINPNEKVVNPMREHPQAIYTSRLININLLPSNYEIKNAQNYEYLNSLTDEINATDKSFFSNYSYYQSRCEFPEIIKDKDDKDGEDLNLLLTLDLVKNVVL